MTIINARSLSPADIHHLGTNLAATIRRDRHDAHVAIACPSEARRAGTGARSLIPTRKEPLRC